MRTTGRWPRSATTNVEHSRRSGPNWRRRDCGMTETFASLGSSLPKADGNGLSDMGPELLRDRKKIRAAVILFDCSEMVEKTDTGDRIAKVRIRRIEVIPNREDAAIMQRLLMRAW